MSEDITLVASNPDLARAEGLWFEDCGLIIQAQSTLFRVSRDFLAIRSPIFQDMLSMPTPSEADMMDGCPFVRLPDSAQDFTYFLKALLYSDFFESYPVVTTFPIVAGVLRMSHKYEVDYLRKRALIHLSSLHPTTFADWDAYEAAKTDGSSPFYYLDIILLARQVSALWILPTAFYRTCNYVDLDSIINGNENYGVGPADKVVLLAGVRKLETTGTSSILHFLLSPRRILHCKSRKICSKSRIAARIKAEIWRHYEDDVSTTLLPFAIWGNNDWDYLSSCCSTCISSMKAKHQQAKQSLWDQLPAIFGLPDWTELTRMKAEALD